jgi:hypothetical protein
MPSIKVILSIPAIQSIPAIPAIPAFPAIPATPGQSTGCLSREKENVVVRIDKITFFEMYLL